MPTAGVRLVLPFATPSQNTYQRWHWARQAQLRDVVEALFRRQLTDLEALEPLPFGPPYRVGVEVLRQGPRELDYGNLVGGCKPLLDALVRAGVLFDDSPRWVRETYAQERVGRGREATRVWAYPAIEGAGPF